METLSAIRGICEKNSPVTGGFPLQKFRNAEFDVSLMLALANSWINRQVADYFRLHDAYCDVIVMITG